MVLLVAFCGVKTKILGAMREVRTQIEIAASREEVWEVLTDFARYPEWNPVIVSVKGELRAGANVDIKIRQGKLAVPIPCRMHRVEPLHDFRWRGPRNSLMAKVMGGEHYFSLEPLRSDAGEERCVFVHGEQFRGAVVPLLWPRMKKQLEAGYSRVNRALKERVEAAKAKSAAAS
ncbi:MAG: SRPBCC family protein [Polyangiaceae bacterium]